MTEKERFEYEQAREIYRTFLSESGIDMRRPNAWAQFLVTAHRSPEGRQAYLAYRQQRALALAEELAKQKTPAELLEISIRKIEGQDLPTLQVILRRLREHRAKLAPITKRDLKMMEGVYKTAVSAVASLEDEPDDSNEP